MKRTIYESLVGLLFSIIGFFVFIGFYDALAMLKIEPTWGGDKGRLFWGIFLGLPVGCAFGIGLINKFYFKVGIAVPGMVLSIVLGIIASFIGVFLLDKFGGWFLVAIPLLVVAMSVCGYSMGSFIK